ncbi:uncharacterized protein LOC115213383 isoform X2 [Octopus sinensis]|uniref:Uncharacterized protein LOC115213383 isoform X2 n=1 Tax=Octopus sinensis TaxID=2607531 RepID=A0A6P7SIH5_9MOLL|nr:uncharacterized protein LOC115213383 isoform X2 [Octopus sinensis]XP_036359518.1 uncharacterized protein LOC115213383 isoform X2 [Octopus sinensis]
MVYNSFSYLKLRENPKMKINQKAANKNVSVFNRKLFLLSLGACLVAFVKIPIFSQWLFDSKAGEIKDSNGWNVGDEEALRRFSISFCDIDRKSISDITSKEFEHQYRLRKPLILTFQNGAKDWINSSMWSRSELKKKYGQWLLLVGNAREIVRHGGNGHIQTSVEDFLDDKMQKTNLQGEPLYVFDRYFYQDSDLPSSLKFPKLLKFKEHLHDSLFFLGSTGTGVTFHKHADAWNAVVFGKKRWFLYPPKKAPPGGIPFGFTILEWFDTIYPTLDESNKPIECIQEAGEILYLPESYYHSTLNIGDTVAIGIQKKEPATEIEKLFYEELKYHSQIIEVKNQRLNSTEKEFVINKQTQIQESLLKLLPANTEVHLKLSEIYSLAGRFNEAFKHSTKAMELDPLFVVAYLTIANQFFMLGRNTKAEEMFQKAMVINPKLWDVYAQYGSFLVNTHHTEQAIEIFQKGIELEPNMTAFWYHLMMAQIQLGDTKGAEISSQQMERLNAQH